jgi:hypothetical protein
VEDLALCELLNGDVVSLVEVNFRNKSLVSCGYCIYLVLIDLVCFVPIYVLELLRLQRSPAEVCQYHCATFNSARFCSFKFNFEFRLRTLILSEVPVQCRKFRHILIPAKNFSGF